MSFYEVVKMRFDIGSHVVVYRNSNKAPPEFRYYTLPGLACNKVDCLQSAFSHKIRLVLISSSAIANHDVIITIRD